MKILLCIYMIINSWTDIKNRQIQMLWTILFVLAVILWKILTKDKIEFLGIVPGFIFWMASKTMRGWIGEGDGIVCMAIGLSEGIMLTIKILTTAFFLTFIYGVLEGLRKQNKEIPFMPFLLCGVCWVLN